MKSDQIQRRSKESLTEGPGAVFGGRGELFPVSALSPRSPENSSKSISSGEDVLARVLADLSASPAAQKMIREAGEQGWRIGLAPLEQHDFHLDVPEKIVLVSDQGLAAPDLARAPYFYHTLQISLIRALRDAWQEKRHGGFDVNYVPESVLLLERLRAADCDVMTILVGWELREEKQDGLWRHLMGSEEGDMALVFSKYLEKDPSALQNGKALAAAFRQWFGSVQRVNACDHETLEYMDNIMGSAPGSAVFGKKPAGRICVEVLSCLPDKTAYLRGQGEDILRDPLFAGLCDPINQSHFMHIMRDTRAIIVQGVPFRDARLAALIFPGGEMTPEHENCTQKS